MPPSSSYDSVFEYELLDRKPGHWVRLLGARVLYNLDGPAHEVETITEEQAQAMQTWCQENSCGVRMSYDMWKFRNRKELTLFLLRWT